MDNPETLATVCIQANGRRETKQKTHYRKLNRWAIVVCELETGICIYHACMECTFISQSLWLVTELNCYLYNIKFNYVSLLPYLLCIHMLILISYLLRFQS